MKGFIIDNDYSFDERTSKLIFIGRLDDGETFKFTEIYSPYFFIMEKDLDKVRNIIKIYEGEIENTNLKNLNNEPVVKINLVNPKDVSKIRKELEDINIKCFEADIRFTQRYLIDKNILSTIEIKGDYQKGERINRVYENAEIRPVEFEPKLELLSIDIETDVKAKNLYAIGMYGDKVEKVIILSDKKLRNAISVKSEREMLEIFKEEFLKADPDVVTGWNLIDFDLKILKDKFSQHKIRFDIGRSDEEGRVRIEKSFMKESSAHIPGRVVIDGISMLKSALIRLDDYKLSTAAREFLGENKLIPEENKGEEIEKAFKKDPQKLVDYNLKDAKLVFDILKKNNIFELIVKRSLLTGISMSRSRGSIAAFDSLYLRELRKRGYVAPCSSFDETEERVTGGFVMESKPGIYKNVAVLDFKSLYPSIIRTFNIDPLTYSKSCTKEMIKAPNGACFKREEGILPSIIQKIWEERDRAKKRKDEVASTVLKTIMNSFYGVLASPNCRFYNLEIANAITHFARFFIKNTAEEIRKKGYNVIYGDTDSIFVDLNIDDIKKAEVLADKLQKEINYYYKEFIKKEYDVESYLEIKVDKVYSRFLMPRLRGAESGAKKRYAGLLYGKVDMVGLEFVRRDWTELAKRFQLELFERIFSDEKVTGFIQDFIVKLRKGVYDELLIYKKAIRKEITEYTKTTPPHVKAARKMRNGLKSTIVEYVMTINGPEPKDERKSRIDYEHYIEKQLKPIADSILVFFNSSFDEVIKGSKQKTLEGF